MSLTLVFELQRELRRLSIAGCSLARGDFKLKKMLPHFQQLGKNIPVFAKISLDIEQVIDPKDDRLQEPFLELVTLVNAVLYTQAISDIQGELQKPRTLSLEEDTYVSYRKLAPLIQALTTSGSGRKQIIEDGFAAGYFKDLRVIPHAVKAVGDSYPEIADFISTNVIPLYGKEVLPLLQGDFDVKGKKADARRLRSIYHLLGEPEGKNFLLETAENGSVEIKLEAIDILAEYPDTLQILEEFSKSKNKTISDHALSVIKSKTSTLAKVKGFFKKWVAPTPHSRSG